MIFFLNDLPAVLSKKYVFMEVFLNFVTRFLCFLYVSKILIMIFFLNDLQSVNFENQITDDDVNRAYSKFETSFIEIM
jgi:hypothetical protein